jgi:hypothetical protein
MREREERDERKGERKETEQREEREERGEERADLRGPHQNSIHLLSQLFGRKKVGGSQSEASPMQKVQDPI